MLNHTSVREATRLYASQARLGEATALLQRMLRGTAAPRTDVPRRPPRRSRKA